MTVAAMKFEHNVLAAIVDSASGGTSSTVLDLGDLNSKLMRGDRFIFAFRGHFRYIQVIQQRLDIKSIRDGTAADRTFEIVSDIVEDVRKLLAEYQCLEIRDGEAYIPGGGSFLLGVNKMVFQVNTRFQLLHAKDGYDAIGSGGEKAYAVLGALDRLCLDIPTLKLPVEVKLQRAADEAARTTGNVNEGFFRAKIEYY